MSLLVLLPVRCFWYQAAAAGPLCCCWSTGVPDLGCCGPVGMRLVLQLTRCKPSAAAVPATQPLSVIVSPTLIPGATTCPAFLACAPHSAPPACLPLQAVDDYLALLQLLHKRGMCALNAHLGWDMGRQQDAARPRLVAITMPGICSGRHVASQPGEGHGLSAWCQLSDCSVELCCQIRLVGGQYQSLQLLPSHWTRQQLLL